MGKLLLIFIVVPLVELVLLIKISDALATQFGSDAALGIMVGLIVVTGLIGGFMAKRQGLAILQQLQSRMRSGEVPGQQLIDGAIVLVSGALLITPGVLTDALGFAGLISPTRALMRRGVLRWFKRSIEQGTVHVTFQGQTVKPGPREEKDDAIDIGN